MNSYIKKIIVGIFFVSLLVTGKSVFAQSSPIDNININTVNKTVSGKITGNEPNSLIYLYFQNNSNQNALIETIPWQAGNFSVSISDFIFEGATAKKDGKTYDTFVVTIPPNQGYPYSLAELLGTGQSDVTVDFPGWAKAEYRPIASSGEYYPYVESDGTLTREPSSAPLYLFINNLDTFEKTLLEVYDGGSSSLNIAWPVAPPEESYLVPGSRYEIYLSDVEDGSLGVATTQNSKRTDVNLGLVPAGGVGNEVVEVDSMKAAKEGDKNYYKITGTIKKKVENAIIYVGIRPKGSSSVGSLLAQIPYQEGYDFSIPDAADLENFEGIEEGSYEVVFHRSVTTGPEIIAGPFSLPDIVAEYGNGEGGTNGNGGSGSGGNGGGGVVYNDTQKDILENGIVVDDCGYNLSGDKEGKQGRMCNFNDAIRLIQRIIEYIFILVLPIMAIVFAYAGYLYLTSGGSKTKRDAAKKAMTNVLIGVIVVMAAWLIVKTIVGALGVDSSVNLYLDI